MKKRILSLCLALIMVLALTPAVVAATTITGTGWTFNPNTQKLTITGDTLGAYTGFERTDVKTVYIRSWVEKIGAHAFKDMTNLEEVEWETDPAYFDDENELKLTEIGDGAFENCTSLKNVKFPYNLHSVGANAFAGCTSLERVEVYSDDMQTFALSAFDGCTNLDPDCIINETNDANITAIINDLKAHSVSFSGHTLFLSDDIGVMFGVEFKMKAPDDNKCRMGFKISCDPTGTETFVDSRRNDLDPDNKYYFYTFDINPLMLADEITATFYVKNGDNWASAVVNKYSAVDYIDYVLKDNHAQDLAGEKADQLKELACALQDYGHYLQLSGWTDGKSHNTIAVSASNNNLSAVIDSVGEYAIRYEDDEFPVKIGLSLNSQNNLYVNAGSTTQSETSIGPNNFDHPYEFEFGGKKIYVSVLSYVYVVLHSEDYDTFTLAKRNAVAALYYYWAAAEAYAPNND